MKNFTRGGQVALHQIRMLKQVVRVLTLSFILIFGLTTVISLWWQVEDKPFALSLFAGQMKASFMASKSTEIEFKDSAGRRFTMPANRVSTHPWVNAQNQQLHQKFKHSSFIGMMSALGFIFILLFIFRTRVQNKTRIIHGSQLKSAREVKHLMKKAKVATNLTIGDCPIPKRDECQHFLLHGTTGSGKSQAIQQILRQLRAQGKRAVIYDKGGELLEKFYRPDKDILLNPLDERSRTWSLWAECQHESDYDALAESFIPMPPAFNNDPFWIQSARTLFVSTMQALAKDKPSHAKLLQVLLGSDLSALQHLLKNTEAESLVSEEIAKTALNIKSVLSNNIRVLKTMDDSPNPFIISDWVKQENDSWLFLTSQQNQHALLKPLISAFLNIAFYSLLSLDKSQRGNLWVMLDELPSLHRLPHLMPTLAEGRKFGGRFVIAMQNYSQLQSIYGRDDASTLASLCNTKLFLRSEGEVNRWVSEQLGEVEIEEETESLSYGASAHRDGVNLGKRKRTKPLILKHDIAKLDDLSGYLKLKNRWPVAKVNIPWMQMATQAPGFILKSNDGERQIFTEENNNILADLFS